MRRQVLEYTAHRQEETNSRSTQVKEVVTSLIGQLAECSDVWIPRLTMRSEPDKAGFSAAMAAIARYQWGEGAHHHVQLGRSQHPVSFEFPRYRMSRISSPPSMRSIGRATIYIAPAAFGTPPFVERWSFRLPGIHMAGLGGYQRQRLWRRLQRHHRLPGRPTDKQPIPGWVRTDSAGDLRLRAPSGPSVSWKDAGLPIYIPAAACILPPTPVVRRRCPAGDTPAMLRRRLENGGLTLAPQHTGRGGVHSPAPPGDPGGDPIPRSKCSSVRPPARHGSGIEALILPRPFLGLAPAGCIQSTNDSDEDLPHDAQIQNDDRSRYLGRLRCLLCRDRCHDSKRQVHRPHHLY